MALSTVPVAWCGKMPTPAPRLRLPDTSRGVQRKLGAISRAAYRKEVVTEQKVGIPCIATGPSLSLALILSNGWGSIQRGWRFDDRRGAIGTQRCVELRAPLFIATRIMVIVPGLT